MAQSKTSLLSSGKKFMVGQETGNFLPKYNYSNGAGWCIKRERKKAGRAKGSTAGRQKGLNCQATYLEKHMAKCSRSYKHREYSSWLQKTASTSRR